MTGNCRCLTDVSVRRQTDGAGTAKGCACCSRGWRVLGDARWCWTIWLSPFCTTPIRQALTLNGETALLHAGAFCRASTDATLKKVRDDARPRPAAISRHCCDQNSIEDLHNEDRLPGRPCDDRNIICDATHTALVFKSARDRLQQRQSAVHARWHVSAVAGW